MLTLRTSPATRIGVVVVCDIVPIHELANVVGIVAGVLKPDRQILIIEAVTDKLRITT
jgi:hypothetical protein